MTNQVFNQLNSPLTEKVLVNKKADHKLISNTWTKFHTGAFIGLLGGFLSLLSAVFLTVFEYFSGEKSHNFWFFLAVYPLFAIGVHCLDKISELKKRRENISHENEEQDL